MGEWEEEFVGILAALRRRLLVVVLTPAVSSARDRVGRRGLVSRPAWK